jgi:hypothetical protein
MIPQTKKLGVYMAISDDGMSSSESVGFGTQIGDSFKGILFGMIAFPLSFYLIFKVETCTQSSEAFTKAVPVSEMQEGKPTYVTGKVSSQDLSGQFVKPGKYIRISQSSEIYAWDEETETKGSGSNKTTEKKCVLKWVSSSDNPNTFTLPGCKTKQFYQNLIPNKTYNADGGNLKSTLGKDFKIDLDSTSYVSNVPSRDADDSEVSLNGLFKGNGYIYTKQTCVSSPEQEGCERIKLTVTPVPNENMTFFGKVTGDSIGAYTYENETFLTAGVGDKEQVFATMKSDDAMMIKVGRIACFLLMWAALAAMIGPVTTLLDFIPFIGGLGAGALRFLMGGVAFVLTLITILFINLWYVLLIGLFAAVGYGYYKRKNQLKSA